MEKSIEIRSLDGKTINLSITPDTSIADLKKTLKNSFPPAKDSPNFHLFFKGSKLSLHSQLDSHQISDGGFIVLVPFAKKSQQLPSPQESAEESTASLLCPQNNSISSASNSAWLDIMADLSHVSNVSPDSAVPNSNTYTNTLNHEKEMPMNETTEKHSTNVWKKSSAFNKHTLHDILTSDPKDVFDPQTSAEISQLVSSVKCLSNSNTGRCLLFENFGRKFDIDSCVCPSWLIKVLKCFNFLNILHAFFLAQSKSLSWTIIEKVLKHSSSFRLDDVCISDVENLSILCPKSVIILGRHGVMELNSGSAITIGDGDSSMESSVLPESTKKRRIARMHPSTLISAVERRGSAFRTDLWRLIKCCMEKSRCNGGSPIALSLDVLLTLKKNGIGIDESNNEKFAKPGTSASVCHGLNHLGPLEMVDHLKECIAMDGQIAHVEYITAKEAVYVEIPNDLSDGCKMALKKIGISRLYSHQAEAIQSSLSAKNVVVATSTSSGKSLCYNVPVLEALSTNPSSCALYIFPTKALAQDQLRALLDMSNGFNVELTIAVYDGDTSQENRTWIRDNARLLITNPDMLHTSILPYHTKFQRLLSNLRTIVIDEAHVYKGAFGCHTALVLRRLRRICSLAYGSDPSFIFSTATSANPREHAMELANLQTLELIQNDGSPSGQKYFLLWNPPLRLGPNLNGINEKKSLNREFCMRRLSPMLEAAHLFAEMIKHGLRCIAFCKTRKLSELVLCYTREILQESGQNLANSICVYRGGYTPEDRRSIERRFFGGTLLGIAATNALELGIDVGHIDATLHLGFPGSVASLWQQAGRSGRRSRPSLAIYVAFEGPLDQHFMKFPHKLFKSPIEHCQVDGQNQKVLEQHIACAALELPLCTQYDEKYFGSGLRGAISSLKNKGYLCSDLGSCPTITWNYIGPEDRPSMAFSLRAIETERYKVINELSNEVLEEIEESRAFFQVYEGAVYMHQGLTYLVKTLNLSERIAYCRNVDLKYYTKTRDSTVIHISGGDLVYPPVRRSEFEYLRTTAQVNSCMITTKWFGFHRILKSSNKIYDTVELHLPEFSYESQAVWIRVPQPIREAVEIEGLSFCAGLHAASHALLNVVPLYVMCNSSDLSTECPNPHETRNAVPGRLLLYDKHPGGIGITAQIQLLFGELLTAAFEIVSTCNCVSPAGCPNCVQALLCGEYNEVLDKKAAAIILKAVNASEDAYFKSCGESSAWCD